MGLALDSTVALGPQTGPLAFPGLSFLFEKKRLLILV